METVYACTHISKEVELDHFETGLMGERTCTMHESKNIEASTFAELLDNLRERFSIALDDLFIPDESEPIEYFGWNRLENNYGDAPTESEVNKWKEGRQELWLADWSFMVERRTVEPIDLAEIKAIVKTH